MNNNKVKFYRVFNIILFVLLVITFINYKMPNKVTKSQRLENKDYDTYTEYLFLGDSITNNYTLQKYYPEYPIINSGIGGDQTENILNNLEYRVFKYKPKKVILLIGINDLTHFKTPSYVAGNIEKITDKIKEKFPRCEIYIEAIYPVNYSWKIRYEDTVPSMNTMIRNIRRTNEKIESICERKNYKYIDTFSLLEENGILKEEYSKDGIHLNDAGYEVVTKFLIEKIFNSSVKETQI